MYKRILHIIYALSVLLLVACSKEEAAMDVTVQFNAAVSPEMTVLVKGGEAQPEPVIANHAVLQAWRGDIMAAQAEQDIVPGTTRISFGSIKLAGGAEYLIYVWVDCAGYYNTADLRNVCVNPEKAYDGRTAEFDAFYSCSVVNCGQDDEVHNVTLKRPFAKVSFSAAVTKDAHISFTAPVALNLKTGKVSGSRDVNYTVSHTDSGVEAFDYIFADEGVSQMNYTFSLGEEDSKTAMVQMSRNKKTNIIYMPTN